MHSNRTKKTNKKQINSLLQLSDENMAGRSPNFLLGGLPARFSSDTGRAKFIWLFSSKKCISQYTVQHPCNSLA
jgi:hypothetical protein